MFPFLDIQREYSFQNEKFVFDKLNELTYNKFWKEVEADFVEADPPTFDLWFTGDMQYSGKPFSMKLNVRLNRFSGGVRVIVSASANKMFYLVSLLLSISLIVSILKGFSLSAILVTTLIIIGLIIWDRWAKAKAFKKLEKILS